MQHGDLRHHFLGIDESHHGRDPEIIVGVYSNYPDDVLPRRYKHKERTINREIMGELHKSCCFKYMLLSREWFETFNERLVKSIALAEFIFTGSVTDKVLMDGQLPEGERSLVRYILGKEEIIPELQLKEKADTNYPIVHSADSIANRIMRLGFEKGMPEEYRQFRIYPEMDHYKKVLKGFY